MKQIKVKERKMSDGSFWYSGLYRGYAGYHVTNIKLDIRKVRKIIKKKALLMETTFNEIIKTPKCAYLIDKNNRQTSDYFFRGREWGQGRVFLRKPETIRIIG